MKKKKMSHKHKISLAVAIIAIIVAAMIFIPETKANYPENSILMETSMGDIVIQLNPEAAPITVENFKSYVKDGFYDGLVFHRVIEGFMIQGGGFDSTGKQMDTEAPIKLESNNGLSNDKYTIAMARTMIPDSATSQFFINSVDNGFLNYAPGNDGYAVFGKVIDGFEVVDKISKVKTSARGYMQDWPTKDVVIEKVSLL